MPPLAPVLFYDQPSSWQCVDSQQGCWLNSLAIQSNFASFSTLFTRYLHFCGSHFKKVSHTQLPFFPLLSCIDIRQRSFGVPSAHVYHNTRGNFLSNNHSSVRWVTCVALSLSVHFVGWRRSYLFSRHGWWMHSNNNNNMKPLRK